MRRNLSNALSIGRAIVIDGRPREVFAVADAGEWPLGWAVSSVLTGVDTILFTTGIFRTNDTLEARGNSATMVLAGEPRVIVRWP